MVVVAVVVTKRVTADEAAGVVVDPVPVPVPAPLPVMVPGIEATPSVAEKLMAIDAMANKPSRPGSNAGRSNKL